MRISRDAPLEDKQPYDSNLLSTPLPWGLFELKFYAKAKLKTYIPWADLPSRSQRSRIPVFFGLKLRDSPLYVTARACEATSVSEYTNDEIQPLATLSTFAAAPEAFYISVKLGVYAVEEGVLDHRVGMKAKLSWATLHSLLHPDRIAYQYNEYT